MTKSFPHISNRSGAIHSRRRENARPARTHGIGSLYHPFNDATSAKGNTDNLMDYNDKEMLWHFQWDNMQKPPRRIFKWKFEEEEAEMVDYDLILANADFPLTFTNSNGDIVFLTPSKEPLILPKNIKAISFSNKNIPGVAPGAITYFATDDGKKYIAVFKLDGDGRADNFYGYAEKDGADSKDLKTYLKRKDGKIEYYSYTIPSGLGEAANITVGYNRLCGVDLYKINVNDCFPIERIGQEFSADINTTGSGPCTESFGFDLNNLEPLTMVDSDVCLKNTLAIDFFNKASENVGAEGTAIVLRIAKIFDGIIDKHIGALDETVWLDYLDRVFGDCFAEKSEWNLKRYEYFGEVLESFLKSKEDLETQILNCGDKRDIMPIAHLYFAQYPQSLKKEVRIHILEVLCDGMMQGDIEVGWYYYLFPPALLGVNVYNLANNHAEENIIDLLSSEYFTQPQCVQLIEYLKHEKPQILFKILQDVDGDNFTSMTNSLLGIFQKAYDIENMEAEASFEWDVDFKQYDKRISSKLYPEENKIYFPTEIGYIWDINPGFGSNHKVGKTVVAQPFSVVSVRMASVPDFMSDYGIKAGQTIKMPAFFLHWICNEQQNKEIKRYIITAACIAAFFVGAGVGTISKELIGHYAKKYIKDKSAKFAEGCGKQFLTHYLKYLTNAFVEKRKLDIGKDSNYDEEYKRGYLDYTKRHFGSFAVEIIEGGVNNCIGLMKPNAKNIDVFVGKKEFLIKEGITCLTSINYGDLVEVYCDPKIEQEDKKWLVIIERILGDCVFNMFTKPFLEAFSQLPNEIQQKAVKYIVDWGDSVFTGFLNDFTIDGLKNVIQNNITNE